MQLEALVDVHPLHVASHDWHVDPDTVVPEGQALTQVLPDK
jgi:hypothetical protein